MAKKNQLTVKQKVEDALYRLRGSIEAYEIDSKAIQLLEDIENADEKDRARLQEQNAETIDQFIKLHEFDKHFLLAESLPQKYRAMSVEMAKSLIREHNCTTTTEKSLVEVIVSTFCRVLHIGSLMSAELDGGSIPLNQNFINYFNFLSKELDKANRQYLTALTTLQQLKSPPMKVSLKAQTAIVGQNQQFNSIEKDQNENNKPK